jgi:hypothetical protein
MNVDIPSVSMLNVVMLSVGILNVVMQSGVVLSVLAPQNSMLCIAASNLIFFKKLTLNNDFKATGYSANEGISAPCFCRQVVIWFPDMFCNFYLLKKHKIA